MSENESKPPTRRRDEAEEFGYSYYPERSLEKGVSSTTISKDIYLHLC